MVLGGTFPPSFVMHILSEKQLQLEHKVKEDKTGHSLTYSAYGLPNMHILPVIAVCYELRLAPAVVIGHSTRSVAPLEVLHAMGPAVGATSLQGCHACSPCRVVTSRFCVVLRPAPCLKKCMHN